MRDIHERTQTSRRGDGDELERVTAGMAGPETDARGGRCADEVMAMVTVTVMAMATCSQSPVEPPDFEIETAYVARTARQGEARHSTTTGV